MIPTNHVIVQSWDGEIALIPREEYFKTILPLGWHFLAFTPQASAAIEQPKETPTP